MSNDTNSLGYNQWFYFSIRNLEGGTNYTFKIVNYVQMVFIFIEKNVEILQNWTKNCQIFVKIIWK